MRMLKAQMKIPLNKKITNIYDNNNAKGLSLAELTVVVILMGAMASLMLPRFTKMTTATRVHDTIIQLANLHAAARNYKAITHKYPQGTISNIDDLNSTFATKIISEGGRTYTYHFGNDACGPYVEVYDPIAKNYIKACFGKDLSTSSSPQNPCCRDGQCPGMNGYCS